MAAAERVFVYNVGSSRARYSNLVKLAFQTRLVYHDVILHIKSNMAAHPLRSSTAEILAFDRNELETGL